MDPLYSIFGLIAIVVVVTLWLLPIVTQGTGQRLAKQPNPAASA